MDDSLHLVIVHEVPGRLRARCRGLRRDAALGQAVEALAEGLPGLADLRVHPATESVIFQYSLEDTNPAAFRGALQNRASLTAPGPEGLASVDSYGPYRPVGARLIEAVRSGWAWSDREALRVTRGTLDVRSTVPWVLLAVAVRQMAINPNLEAIPWWTAFSYSVQALIRYPAPPPPPKRDPWLSSE
jgi:hypothetical protein